MDKIDLHIPAKAAIPGMLLLAGTAAMNAGEKRVKVLNKDKVSLDNLRLRSVYDI